MPFYHNLSPYIVSFGPFAIRWYGLFYISGFLLLYFYMTLLRRKKKLSLSQDQIDSYIISLLFGVVLGARLFYVLFYNPMYYLSHPAEIIAVWHGGLSFHGGLVGALLASYFYCKKHKFSYLALGDIVALPLAFSLFLGRIGNFINGELVGRVTNVPWCFYFPGYEGCRHPSQLYESGKNLLIFFVLWGIQSYKKEKLPKGYLFGLFVVLYSVLRFFIEFVRQPDEQLGFIVAGLTMGQLLNIAMFIGGIFFLYKISQR